MIALNKGLIQENYQENELPETWSELLGRSTRVELLELIGKDFIS